MIDFLESLDEAGIGYVSWKNNHELALALAGDSDLDIFVPLRDRARFMSAAAASGWLRLENPVASYPWVTHLYYLDSKCKVYHLHVYFKLVTGESWLKEFILPFDEWLISKRIRVERLWGLDNRAQAYLHAVRHLLKGGALLSRLLYRRELKSYDEEWRQCGQPVDSLADWGPLHLNRFLDGSGLQSTSLQLPRWRTAMRFRASIAPFLRLPWWQLPYLRLRSLVLRATNKLVYRRKKIFPGGGLIVAISGVDGAGKSTMLKEVGGLFSNFLTLRCLALGKPQGRFVEALRKLIRPGASAGPEAEGPGVSTSASKPTSVRRSLSAAVLALLRLRMARKAMRFALAGELVLVDRWPTDVRAMMDGPRLDPDSAKGYVARLCYRIENWAYRRLPRADLCFFLQTPESVLVERNRARSKVDKETDAEIVARSQQNQSFQPLANKVIPFDNNGPLAEKRIELVQAVWNEIGRHQ